MIPTKAKLIAAASVALVLLSVCSYVTYRLTAESVREYEKGVADKRVAATQSAADELLREQREHTRYYRQLADEHLATIDRKLGNIRVEHVTITQEVVEERERDPAFYEQPIPDTGREQWIKARSMLQD